MDNLRNAVSAYALDPENPELNYAVAVHYFDIGQTAAALSYYLRAAERTNDRDLAYECMIRVAQCFDIQNNRHNSVRGAYKHALQIQPTRPEAYYLLSRFEHRVNWNIESYVNAERGLNFAQFDHPPLRSNVGYPGKYGLLLIKAITSWGWGKGDQCRTMLKEIASEYYNEMDDDHKALLVKSANDLKIQIYVNANNTKKRVVDYFTYFDETCREALELHVRTLEKCVDTFVICESNKTQSGKPIQYNLRNVIKELNLPEEKIMVIELNIPDDDALELLPIDYMNCEGENSKNINSVRARARERMQRDVLSLVLDRFDENTVFIISDCDEVLNPKYVNELVSLVDTIPVNSVMKIPLVYLQGKADMRAYEKSTDTPVEWNGAVIMCSKKHLYMCKPIQIRSNLFNPFNIVYPQKTNDAVDMGWHFSWMGNVSRRKAKRDAFIHYQDKFDFLEFKSYSSQEIDTVLEKDPVEGSVAYSSQTHILKKYPLENLPTSIFENERLKKFFLSEEVEEVL
jgi:hypothetical protein